MKVFVFVEWENKGYTYNNNESEQLRDFKEPYLA